MTWNLFMNEVFKWKSNSYNWSKKVFKNWLKICKFCLYQFNKVKKKFEESEKATVRFKYAA